MTPVEATSPVIAQASKPVQDEPAQTSATSKARFLTTLPTVDAQRLVSAPAPSGPLLTAPWGSSCGLLRGANAMCWGLRDLSKLSLDDAIRTARADKDDKFIWRGVRYIVKADARKSGLTTEEQIARNGITDDQYNRAYVPGMSERFYDRISPEGYGRIISALHAYENRDDGARNDLVQGKWRFENWAGISPNARLDSWALYLGLPQRHATFRVSPHKPAGSAHSGADYLSFADHAMDDALLGYALKKLPGETDDRQGTSAPAAKRSRMLVADDVAGSPDGFKGNKTLGHFMLERRSDERGHYVAYAYTWQLTPLDGLPVVGMFLRTLRIPTPEASDVAGVGHPFEIYGRVYYDPATGKRLDTQP